MGKEIIKDSNFVKGVLTELNVKLSEEAEQIFESIINDMGENKCLKWKDEFEGCSKHQILMKIESLLCMLRDTKSYGDKMKEELNGGEEST